jgi:L-Ala-D/L-Glu epimerase
MGWSYSKVHLELLFTFKISRNSSDFKTNYIIQYEYNGFVGLGECAPNVRYGESLELVEEQLQEFVAQQLCFNSIVALNGFLATYGVFQSVKNAIETCFLDYWAKMKDVKVSELLSIETARPMLTMFTIPILELDKIRSFYETYGLSKFSQIKLKINKETAIENITEVSNIIGNRELFVDANESFESLSEYLRFEERVSSLPITFMEQPFPADHMDDYVRLKPISKFPVFGDESIISNLDMKLVSAQFHGINVKMMKTGGFVEAVRILKDARNLGLKTMVGCMVETSLGISHAFELNSLADYLDLDSFMYIKDEPFKLLRLESGVIDKS